MQLQLALVLTASIFADLSSAAGIDAKCHGTELKAVNAQYEQFGEIFERERQQILDTVWGLHGKLDKAEEIEAIIGQLEAQKRALQKEQYVELLNELWKRAHRLAPDEMLESSIGTLRGQFANLPRLVQQHIDAFRREMAQLEQQKMNGKGMQMNALDRSRLEALNGEYKALNDQYKEWNRQFVQTVRDERGNFKRANRQMVMQLSRQKMKLEYENDANEKALNVLSAKVEALPFEDNSRADIEKQALLGAIQILGRQLDHLPNMIEIQIQNLERQME